MSIALITGSNGLVGSESVNFFCKKGFDVVGIDNDLRKFFFGKDGTTLWMEKKLLKENKNFKAINLDIRNYNEIIITLHEPPYGDENILNKSEDNKYKLTTSILDSCILSPS